MPRELRIVHWITALLVVLALLLDVVNGRFWMNDFRVYWEAAHALIHGRPVYSVPFGEDTGFYKYAPIVAIAFVPSALLPFPAAAVIHFLFIGLALMLCQVVLERLLMRHVFGTYAPRITLRGILGLLFIAVLLARELHLGNINLWLLLGALLATEALLTDAPGRAGLLLGALWLAKPYLLLMAVPLVAFAQWRTIGNAAVVMVAGLLAPIVFLGHATAHALTRSWIQAMLAHSDQLGSPDTITSLLARLTAGVWTLPGPAIIVAAGLTLFLAGRLMQRGGGHQRPGAFALLLWIALALVPNLVITDQEHFLFSLPLIAFILAMLVRRRDLLIALLFGASMFLYALRSSDLWGNSLEAQWAGNGALGIGNLLLVATAAFARQRHFSAVPDTR